MRAVVQRVGASRVDVDGVTVGAIEHGLLVYLGVAQGDVDDDLAWLVDKVVGLRIFSDEQGKMSRDVKDVGGAVLVVSQFTLMGDVKKGRRPSFSSAMEPSGAERTYDAFVRAVAERGIPVSTGKFRADMQVHSLVDGPVTLWLDSSDRLLAARDQRTREQSATTRECTGSTTREEATRHPGARALSIDVGREEATNRGETREPNGQEHTGHQLRHR